MATPKTPGQHVCFEISRNQSQTKWIFIVSSLGLAASLVMIKWPWSYFVGDLWYLRKQKKKRYEMIIIFPQDFKATLLKKDQSKEERKIKDHKLFL